MSASVSIGVDIESLHALYADPWIRARIQQDHRQTCAVQHHAVTYLSARIDDALAGAYMAIRFSLYEIELHSLLKRWAIYRSRELSRLCIDWAFSSHAEVQRITAWVIYGLESVRNHCLKLGFRLEGIRRHAVMQRGRLLDVYMLGMTRAEWEGKQ